VSFSCLSTPRGRQIALVLAVAAPALVILGFHAARYWPFIADDALISLRYGDRLLGGHGLTWTDGERVEGYSNLLWVLGCAALGVLQIDLIAAARVLGALGMGAAIVCVVTWERRQGWRGLAGGAAGGIALAACGGIAVWLVGGLEQPMVAALVALGVLFTRPLAEGEPGARIGPAAAPLALLGLTRPDGPLLVALVALGLLLSRGVSRGSVSLAIRLGLPALAATAAQLAFRLAYYGDYVPNTARAKIALSWNRIDAGWSYVVDGAAWLWPVAGLSLLALWRPRRSLLVVAVPLIGWLAYVVFIGGDIFPGRRHLIPAVVLLGFLIASGVSSLLCTRRTALGAGAVALVALLLGWQGRLTLADPENQRAIHERWEWHGQVIGRLLAHAFADQQPLLAVDAAGCVPYFSRLPALDMLGLNDRYLATHPPADFGTGAVGHELGDGDYVWSRQPDLIMFCLLGTKRACFRGGRELKRHRGFRRAYTAVRFEGRDPYRVRSLLWVRRRGRVGMRVEDGEIVIPGFLLRGKHVVAALGPDLAAEIPAGKAAWIALPEAAGSTWEIELDATGEVTAKLVKKGKRLKLRAGGDEVHVREVRLVPKDR
jgi:hypothetical protein